MKFREFSVVPNLPASLKPLLEIANNLWWAWDSEAFALFRDIDPDTWSQFSHDPVKLLYNVPQERLDLIAADEGFIFRINTVLTKLNQYLSRPAWYDKIKASVPEKFSIAYFSAEFGLAECVPIYSGGLGVLSGDHLKSASDLGIPLIAVGLLYTQGYFHQYLAADGWQQERLVNYDYLMSPVNTVKTKENTNLVLDFKFPRGNVKFQVWKLAVGRITLYLLDTNMPENSPEDRDITRQLYGGDTEMRIKQEILLGIGGMMALSAMGITPSCTHMNEGHAAFLSLERIRLMMKQYNLSFKEAREIVSGSNVFTTHTPVPAGNDRFPVDIIEKYLRPYVEQNLSISFNDFISFGKIYPEDNNETFCMTVLALKFSDYCNGVSKLHGKVSRNMWKDIWKGVPVEEVPIEHITNGIHMNSWISKEMADLFLRYLGTRWLDAPDDHEIWKRISEIPDTELWRTHERRRERLVSFVRRRLKKQLKERGASQQEIDKASEILNPEALTIGFARRFATYKRATLIFNDMERLITIMSDKNMPIQFVFAGKAHPKDTPGKEFIKAIYHMSQREEFRNKIVFVEDYDLNSAHYLVEGVDVWLNNPRRPLEASGTSGMKVNFNGGLNCSTLDGWWDEKADADNGWSIGRGEEYEDGEYQEKIEANALYEILESSMIPLFYKRGEDGLPHDWIKKMKTAMQTLCPVFNTNRMVMEYTEKFYKNGGIQFENLVKNNAEKSKVIAKWKDRLEKKWQDIKVTDIQEIKSGSLKVGDSFKIRASVYLDGISIDDVKVEIYYGKKMAGTIINPTAVRMLLVDCGCHWHP